MGKRDKIQFDSFNYINKFDIITLQISSYLYLIKSKKNKKLKELFAN